MGMIGVKTRRLCVWACTAFSFLLALASCNGNGGSSDSAGAVYMPVPADTTSVSSGNGSSSGNSSSYGVSDADILTLASAGDSGTIIRRLSRGSTSPASTETTTVTLSSSDIGLPAGGCVTLVITGSGISYTADARDAGDGTVHFEIPQIASGTEITVGVIVKRASGTVVCAGSKTQTVSGDSSNIQISLASERPLPAAITVSASTTSITYDAGDPASQTVTFSVVGLEAPEEGTLAYSWKLADGTLLPGSGPGVDVTLDSLFGTAPAAGGLYNKSVQVTVTYTDEEGTATTADGTGVVAVTVLELPSFTIEVTLPEGVAERKDAAGTVIADSYDIADLTKTFTFKATPTAGTGYPAGAFPEGTEFEWGKSYDSTMVGGFDTSSSTGQPDSFDVAPSSLNLMYSQWYATDTTPKTFSVSCSATNGKAINSPKNADSSKTVNLYKPKLPTPKIGYSCEPHIDRLLISATETSLAVQTYFQYDALLPVDFEFWVDVDGGPAMPDGSKWKLDCGNGSYLGTVGGTDTSANKDVGTSLAGVNIGTLTDDTGHPKTSREISVIVEHPCYESSASVPMKFKLYSPPPDSISSFETTLTCDGNSFGDGMSYQVTSGTTFTASIGVGPGSGPDANSGAQFEWYAKINGIEMPTPLKTVYSPDDVTFTMEDLGIDVASLPADWAGGTDGSPTSVSFRCKISFPGTTVEADGSPNALSGYLSLYR